MNTINLTIDGQKVEVEQGTSILDAAKKINIEIPTLCNMYMGTDNTRNCKGTCRVCLVEQEGRGKLIPSCSVKANDGMIINTHTRRVIEARRTIVQLLLSDHPKDCLKCDRNGNCELQDLAEQLGIISNKYEGEMSEYEIDNSSNVIVREMDKCILCRRCVTMCNEVQKVNVLTPIDRGFNTVISTFFNKPLVETDCTYCGQCVAVCPTGALREARSYDKLWSILEDKNKYVIVQTAPAVRVALGEAFGFEVGESITKKMVAALRLLGFDAIYDTNFGADLTIMEETNEFIERFEEKKNLPMLTSCCAAWVNFVESKYPELINHLSSCKSPQQMFGSIAKRYLSKKLNIKEEDIVVVSIMPCVAKKYEANREEMTNDGVKNVDVVITTREFIKMINEAGINIRNLKDNEFDNPLGESSGAGVIFGTTGGVMEAALRTASEIITGETLEKVDFKDVRGFKGIKEGSIKIGRQEINIATVSSLGNAKKIMDEIKSGRSKYDFVEVMACPGGCINGGGQPFNKADVNMIKKRMAGLYAEDENKTIRKSHENPSIKKVYKELLIEPNGDIAHELLHTYYKAK